MLDLFSESDAVLLPVKVVPGARRTRHVGLWEKRAKITIAAPPEKGKANRALIAFLAELLGVRKRDITVVDGLTSPLKMVRIKQVTAEAVRAALSPH